MLIKAISPLVLITFNEYTTFNYIPGVAALETYMPLQFYSAKHASLYE